MALVWPNKDPNEVLDYKIDWSARLAGDTIQTAIWIVPDDIERISDSNTDTTVTIWLAGGIEGAKLTLTSRVTTVGGRTMDQSVGLRIRTR